MCPGHSCSPQREKVLAAKWSNAWIDLASGIGIEDFFLPYNTTLIFFFVKSCLEMLLLVMTN